MSHTAHILPLLYDNRPKLFSLDELCEFTCCTFMYKIANSMLPSVIFKVFVKHSSIHNRTRHCTFDFFLRSVKFDIRKCHITFAGVKVWFLIYLYFRILFL